MAHGWAQRLAGLPCRLFLLYGLREVTHEVHQLYFPSFFLTLSITFVLSLTLMLVILSLYTGTMTEPTLSARLDCTLFTLIEVCCLQPSPLTLRYVVILLVFLCIRLCRRLLRNYPSIFTPLFSQFNLLNTPCLMLILFLIFSIYLCK